MTFSDFIHHGILGYYLYFVKDHVKSGLAFGTLLLLGFIVCMIAGYLLGSINFAIIISNKDYGHDVRDSGSKNAGMTNMLRTYGGRAAGLTLLGDFGKTFVSYLIGTIIFGIKGAYFACFMCVVGHIFPVYYRFRGGKGIVCAASMILLLDPLAFLVILVVFIIVLFGTKFMSLASIMAAMIYPMAHQWVMRYMPNRIWPFSPFFAVITAVLVLWRHWPNMKRLWDRTESKTDIIAKLKAKKESKNENKEDGK